MKRRGRKKLARKAPAPTSARWDFWKTRQGKFAARFSIGIDGFMLPGLDKLPSRFNHIVFGFPSTMQTQKLHIGASNGLVTETDFYWHRISVRFSSRLDPRETLDEVFTFLNTVARIECGHVTLPPIPAQFTERRSEKADIRKRLRRRRTVW